MTDSEMCREIAAELREQSVYGSASIGGWWQRLQDIVLGEGIVYIPKPEQLFWRLSDLIDRPTCRMEDRGRFMPGHEFERMACGECGAMHWEQPHRRLPRMRFCPWCGAEVAGLETPADDGACDTAGL